VSVRRAALGALGSAAAGSALYVLQRAVSARWRTGSGEVAAAGLSLPADLRHRFVATSDGGRIHVVERGGGGPTTVLVHGIMLGVATWSPQLRALPGRVVAVSQRGHGQSRAGTEGYGFERLAADLLEVMADLEVRDALLVGHSMGGMVAELCALTRPDDLARHVKGMVLVSTSPGPVLGTGVAALRVPALAGAAAARALGAAERRGSGPLPKGATVWAARLCFGASPVPAQVELVRGMLDAMSPGALAGLLPHLFAFEVRDRLPDLALPVHVVVGSRDVLTPPRAARAIVERAPGAELTVLAGCGHMVMLERAEALCSLLVR